MTKLDELYCEMWANIKKLIDEGHHPDDIQSDSPELVEDVNHEIEMFLLECENDI